MKTKIKTHLLLTKLADRLETVKDQNFNIGMYFQADSPRCPLGYASQIPEWIKIGLGRNFGTLSLNNYSTTGIEIGRLLGLNDNDIHLLFYDSRVASRTAAIKNIRKVASKFATTNNNKAKIAKIKELNKKLNQLIGELS